MVSQATTHARQAASPAPKDGAAGLRRKCACGVHTQGGAECDGCRAGGSKLQRAASGRAPLREAAPGLTINAPGDAYEQEADRVAELIASASASQVRLHGAGLARSAASREPSRPHAPNAVHEVLSSPGRPLEGASRLFMESRFGHDFSGVRVHTDARAEESAREVDAAAYTVGRHIVFGAGRYQPASPEGRKLLAHELTHVVQQGAGASSPPNLQRQGVRRGDAGAGASPPSQPTSGAAGGLSASLLSANTTGTVDIANCVWRSRRGRPVAIPLGVWDLGVSGRTPWTNHIEFVWQINGAIPPGVTFDIKRVRGDAVCERTSSGGPWVQVDAEPAGTPDDIDNADECLFPQPPGQRIFSNDGPGFPSADPLNTNLLGGGRLSPHAVAVRVRFTFEEWVEATVPGVGSNVTISPRVPWHATISLDNTTPPPGPATWRRTPGEPNDVGLGAISLNCAGGGAAAPARPARTAPRQPAAQTPQPRGR